MNALKAVAYAKQIARPLAWETRVVRLEPRVARGRVWHTYCRVCEELERIRDLYEVVYEQGVEVEIPCDHRAVALTRTMVEGRAVWRGCCRHCKTSHWAWAIPLNTARDQERHVSHIQPQK
jgi:hypothetical protein